MWKVKRTDPWMWPRAEMDDGSRTEEQIQVFSAFWLVAYHCLFFVDFYLWDGTGDWSPPPEFAGGHAEQPIGADGAAPLPSGTYSRSELLGLVDHCRKRSRGVLSALTDEQLSLRCGSWHPHRGKTFRELLQVNLAHLGEHGGQLEAAVRTWTELEQASGQGG
jgi:DinB superfamily